MRRRSSLGLIGETRLFHLRENNLRQLRRRLWLLWRGCGWPAEPRSHRRVRAALGEAGWSPLPRGGDCVMAGAAPRRRPHVARGAVQCGGVPARPGRRRVPGTGRRGAARRAGVRQGRREGRRARGVSAFPRALPAGQGGGPALGAVVLNDEWRVL